MSITLTKAIKVTDLKGVDTTITSVKVRDFATTADGHVVACIVDTVTGYRIGDIVFQAVANVDVIKGQIETYAVSAHLIEGTKV